MEGEEWTGEWLMIICDDFVALKRVFHWSAAQDWTLEASSWRGQQAWGGLEKFGAEAEQVVLYNKLSSANMAHDDDETCAKTSKEVGRDGAASFRRIWRERKSKFKGQLGPIIVWEETKKHRPFSLPSTRKNSRRLDSASNFPIARQAPHSTAAPKHNLLLFRLETFGGQPLKPFQYAGAGKYHSMECAAGWASSNEISP